MAGTLLGGKRASETNKRKYGEDFYRNIGRMGGVAKVPKGFALMPKEKVIQAGVIGGTKSRRVGVKGGQGKKHK